MDRECGAIKCRKGASEVDGNGDNVRISASINFFIRKDLGDLCPFCSSFVRQCVIDFEILEKKGIVDECHTSYKIDATLESSSNLLMNF